MALGCLQLLNSGNRGRKRISPRLSQSWVHWAWTEIAMACIKGIVLEKETTKPSSGSVIWYILCLFRTICWWWPYWNCLSRCLSLLHSKLYPDAPDDLINEKTIKQSCLTKVLCTPGILWMGWNTLKKKYGKLLRNINFSSERIHNNYHLKQSMHPWPPSCPWQLMNPLDLSILL